MYVDPGYGALILQSLFAAIVGASFIARKRVSSLIKWVTTRSARENQVAGSGDSR